jgi:helix-turn-helix protein
MNQRYETSISPTALRGKQAAQYLSISVSLLDLLVKRCELKPRYIGRSRLFRVEDLNRFLDSRPEAR